MTSETVRFDASTTGFPKTSSTAAGCISRQTSTPIPTAAMYTVLSPFRSSAEGTIRTTPEFMIVITFEVDVSV